MTIPKIAATLLAVICLAYSLSACSADETSTADASSRRSRREEAEEEASSKRNQNDRDSTDADDEKNVFSGADTETATVSEATTSSTTTTAATSTTTTAAVTTGETEADKSEPAVEARSGDAYLALADGIWWAQYWGESDSDDGYLNLCYDAGVVHINGNGQYTVSVTSDSDGARFDATGDVNSELILNGIGFCGLRIKDGATVCPDASIRINSVMIDGEHIELIANNYTFTEDGDVGSYIYNPWVSDAGAQIIDVDQIGDWQTIEVNFTVSGLG